MLVEPDGTPFNTNKVINEEFCKAGVVDQEAADRLDAHLAANPEFAARVKEITDFWAA